MKRLFVVLTIILFSKESHANISSADSTFYAANHPAIQLIGRADYTRPDQPRFWAPGVYINIRFMGTYCILDITDEVRWGMNHNYIEVKVDNDAPYRIRLNSSNNKIILSQNLKEGIHNVTVCKNTEADIGYLQLNGIICRKLLSPPQKPERRIEFIGNSITCGSGNDESVIACNTGEWYDQHNAYMAYGPLTARTLNAQWQLSSVSGIGLMYSCCNKEKVMPQVFDKINMSGDSIPWNFQHYQPDVVTVCLGQNDGIQDSAVFCKNYIGFVERLRSYYPNARLILLSSPMADENLNKVLKKYLTAIHFALQHRKEQKLSTYFFSKRYHRGCGSHPNLAEHQEMAGELTAYIKKTMNW
ncbi:MAG: SGNH/GDSL hydrolase family protein [Sediminibacterium sp.]|nr:SGNH/GDSL hydrolase family protein [Sediminibacterium sp.]